MANRYDEKKVLRELDKKGVQVNFGVHQVVVNTNKNNVGIGTLGKIDFLVNYCGWRCIFVKKKDNSNNEDQETNYKKAKKAAKAEAKVKKMNETNENSQKGFLKKTVSGSKRNMNNILKRIK